MPSLTNQSEDENEGQDRESGGGEVGPRKAECSCSGGHKERAYRLARAQGHAVGGHEGPAVLGGSVGVQEREDVGEIDPLRHTDQGSGKYEKGQAGSKSDNTEGDRIEYERRLHEAFLRDAARKAAELGRGQR